MPGAGPAGRPGRATGSRPPTVALTSLEPTVARARETGTVRRERRLRIATDGVRRQTIRRDTGDQWRRDSAASGRPTSAARTICAAPPVTTDPSEASPHADRQRPPNLDYVFDDPADGEPGRDRLLVHGLWELAAPGPSGRGRLPALPRGRSAPSPATALGALLLTGCGARPARRRQRLRPAGRARRTSRSAPSPSPPRCTSPTNADGGLLRPLLLVLGLAAAIGLVQGLVMVGLHVPGWAASLAAAWASFAWIQQRTAPVASGPIYDPAGPRVYCWFGGFCALQRRRQPGRRWCPAVRRGVRPVPPGGRPGRPPGLVAAVITLAAHDRVSSVLAGVGGGFLLGSEPARRASRTAWSSTGLALGVALLGGTSAFGRRGGIFGTVLAVGAARRVIAVLRRGRAWTGRSAALAAAAIGARAGRDPAGRDVRPALPRSRPRTTTRSGSLAQSRRSAGRLADRGRPYTAGRRPRRPRTATAVGVRRAWGTTERR